MTRREFALAAAQTVGSLALGAACRLRGEASLATEGRLTARPKVSNSTAAPGTRPLGLERTRDAILHVPPTTGRASLPLFVLFHGAGGSGERLLRRFTSNADEAGVAMLAPDSRASTWDAIGGSFHRDVTFIDRALNRVFDSAAIDPSRIVAGGFSDGATYALSLGLINGDLFRRIVAFSPGFIVHPSVQGKPQIFVSHGTADAILPIDRCSRVIVPALRRRGYEVTFREFEGGHEIPAEIAREAMTWVASAETRE
jgi:predicted esterase